MQMSERKVVCGLMKRSFPLIQRWFFSLTRHVLVAEQQQTIVGAAVLEVASLPGHRKGGLLYWIFTAPEVRGSGVAQQLLEASLAFFDEQGCDEVLACVEGNNTSSSKLFATRGFSILSPVQQFQRYGFGMLLVWFWIFNVVDIGLFVWARPGPAVEKPDTSPWLWWGTLVANVLVGGVALWRYHAFGSLELALLLPVLLLCIALLVVRHLAMMATARWYHLPVCYRAWESAFPLSMVIAFASGSFFPVPGSLYPAMREWRYRDLRHILGPVAASGAGAVLVLVCLLWSVVEVGMLPASMEGVAHLTLLAIKPFALVNIALPFFPFSSFDGRRIWDWNTWVWGVMSLVAIMMVVVV
jgi:L-amino acid N-acyltransferase YncA